MLINSNQTVRVVAEQTTRKIPRHSYEDQLKRFDNACEWLSHFGVKVNPTRIGSCRRILAEIAAKHREGGVDELLSRHGFPALANTLFESTELIGIHHGLLGIEEGSVAQSLQKFTEGCSLLIDECRTGNNIGRNIGFELDTAALFRQCGFPVELRPPADVWVKVGDTDVAIECKRPFSYDALGTNIEKAFSQLRKRYRDHVKTSPVRGVAALSASKMENDGSLMLKANNTADLNAAVRRISEQFVARTEEFWGKTGDERTIGLIVTLRAPSHVEDINLFTVVRHLTWIGLARTTSDQRLFRRVADAHIKVSENAENGEGSTG